MILGKGAHHLRVLDCDLGSVLTFGSFSKQAGLTNESWIDAGAFNELARELVNHAGIGKRRRALDVHLLAELLQELIRLLRVKLLVGRELLARGLLKLGDHLNLAPRRLPVDLVRLSMLGREGGLVRASKLLDQ